MDWVTLKAAEWLPDLPDLDNPGATVAKNCYAAAGSYKPIKALSDYSVSTGTSTSDFIRGAMSMKDGNGVSRVYAGDAGKLYTLSATSWNDISVAGAYSGTSTTELWKFALFGPSLIVATNFNNAPQKIVPGSAAVALGGSPPRARYVTQVRDWVVLANVNDGTPRPNRVQWSGYNNAEQWGRSVAFQSDYQDLYEGGAITGIAESNGSGVIISENAVHVMSYAGPPITWRFDRVANALGSKVPGSVVSHRDRVWWFGESDIWEYSGNGIRGVAFERISKTFFSLFDANYKHRVTAAVDPINNLVVWGFPAVGSTGAPNYLLIYAFNVDRWTLAEVTQECLVQFLTPGYTLEGLDSLSGSIDALGASLDSDIYKGGQLSLAAFKTSKVLASFGGTPLTAVIDTAELRLQAGKHTEATSFRPLHEGGSARVSVGTRASQSSPVTWTTPREPSAISGECNIRANSRFLRARLELSGDWTHAIGVDAKVRSGNRR